MAPPKFLTQLIQSLDMQGLVKKRFGLRMEETGDYLSESHLTRVSSPGILSLEGQGNLPGFLGGSKRSLAPSRKLCP